MQWKSTALNLSDVDGSPPPPESRNNLSGQSINPSRRLNDSDHRKSVLGKDVDKSIKYLRFRFIGSKLSSGLMLKLETLQMPTLEDIQGIMHAMDVYKGTAKLQNWIPTPDNYAGNTIAAWRLLEGIDHLKGKSVSLNTTRFLRLEWVGVEAILWWARCCRSRHFHTGSMIWLEWIDKWSVKVLSIIHRNSQCIQLAHNMITTHVGSGTKFA